jgi:CRISPR-associated protein Csb1
VPAVDYVKAGLLEEPADLRDSEGKVKGTHPFASRGFAHQPVSKPENIRGGVFADGGIRRDATLSLAALKLLRVGEDETKTHALRRYILGLSLTAFTYQSIGYLRQGCLLVLDPQPSTPNEFVEVFPNGTRKPFALTHAEALAYASEVAVAFEVGASETVPFDKERAKKDVTGEDDENPRGRKSNKNKKTE